MPLLFLVDLEKRSDIIIEQILNYAMKYEVPVVLGSDAHFYMQIGDFYIL